MLTFDLFGNLFPYKIIESNFEEIKDALIFNPERTILFDAFCGLIDEIKTSIPTLITIWIDGSFVSLKKVPHDIDVVVFVPFEYYFPNSGLFRNLKKSLIDVVDCYFVCQYPENHPKYFWFQSDKTEYLFLFSTDKSKRKKGVLQIIV